MEFVTCVLPVAVKPDISSNSPVSIPPSNRESMLYTVHVCMYVTC